MILNLLWGVLLALLARGVLADTPKNPALVSQPSGVVVVLAGGGAKGFAHLAVLRQLERDQIPIARIVGTSMGAVIGGLYASGLSTDTIERVIGGLDPNKVALDQLNRLELPAETRAYQQKYPVSLEFGVRDGALSFARGVSDGQRFLALIQKLTAHVPSDVDFNDLKIPFRAVATRYRDGEMKVFDRGALHLAIRASMSAPAVFAPVEVDGETYVDGGLVSNLPIDVALREGADVIVASYLGSSSSEKKSDQGHHALTVANQMIAIMIRQNETRNLSLLRPQDVLVKPQLQDVGFADFGRAHEIVLRSQVAVSDLAPRWAALKRQASSARLPDVDQRPPAALVEKRVVAIEAKGAKRVPEKFIRNLLSPMLGEVFNAQLAEQLVDQLYTRGDFDLVSYDLQPHETDGYKWVVHVREKPYSPHFFKPTLGFSTEVDGVTQLTMGMGYRRPWLNPSGLELLVDGRIGTQSELAVRLAQPLSPSWRVESGLSWDFNHLPVYKTVLDRDDLSSEKLAYFNQSLLKWDAQLVYDFQRKANVKLGLTSGRIKRTFETVSELLDSTGNSLSDFGYNGLRAQVQIDQLDSVSFPTRGYFLSASVEQGISGTRYGTGRVSAKVAHSIGPHIFNAGFNWAQEKLTQDCEKCQSPSILFLGGFQAMGAYRMGQLAGNQLAHVQGTYMYRLSQGGMFQQGTYLGTVLEAGDAWSNGDAMRTRYSTTAFLAVDSKIGDIYLGAAKGTGNVYNLFIQLGRRFSF
jgi:NTE family protein